MAKKSTCVVKNYEIHSPHCHTTLQHIQGIFSVTPSVTPLKIYLRLSCSRSEFMLYVEVTEDS